MGFLLFWILLLLYQIRKSIGDEMIKKMLSENVQRDRWEYKGIYSPTRKWPFNSQYSSLDKFNLTYQDQKQRDLPQRSIFPEKYYPH